MPNTLTDLICSSQQIITDLNNRNILYTVGMLTTLAERAIQLRNELGLTQRQVADQVGMTQQAYNDVEKGKSKRPRNIERLAKTLKTTPQYLQFGSDLELSAITYSIPVIPMSEVIDWPFCMEVAAGEKKEQVLMHVEGFENCYVLHVANDLMSPELNPGDTIIVDPNKKPKDGSFVVAHQQGASEAMLKKFVIDGDDHYLYSLKPGPRPLKVDDTIKISGVVRRVRPPDRVLE